MLELPISANDWMLVHLTLKNQILKATFM